MSTSITVHDIQEMTSLRIKDLGKKAGRHYGYSMTLEWKNDRGEYETITFFSKDKDKFIPLDQAIFSTFKV